MHRFFQYLNSQNLAVPGPLSSGGPQAGVENVSQHRPSLWFSWVGIAGGLGTPWRLTGFYGHPTPAFRHQSWALLRNLSLVHQSLPWVCFEDFNQILNSNETSNFKARNISGIKSFKLKSQMEWLLGSTNGIGIRWNQMWCFFVPGFSIPIL